MGQMSFTLRFGARISRMSTPAYFHEVTGGARAKRGNAAAEFAIVAPLLLVMMAGIFNYGGYFFIAHTVQQLANDSARAAIAGLDDSERASLAESAVRAGMQGQPLLSGELAEVAVSRNDGSLRVFVHYNAENDIFWTLATLIPSPSPDIRRSATIRLGGL